MGGDYSEGDLSLREAIKVANIKPGAALVCAAGGGAGWWAG